MKELYFDTNIFIYLFDKSSIYHKPCQDLVNYCHKENITIYTCAETFQEIIHYSKNIKQLEKGLETAAIALEIADQILAVTEETIKLYLKQAEVIKSIKSRDLIHYAVCLENKINTIITIDGDFKKFKEIKILKPEEFLAQI